jgi:hypothetical protein
MNEEKLIEIIGRERYEEIKKLSKAQSDIVRNIINNLPPGADLSSMKVGYDGDDFVNNKITLLFKIKV